MEKFKSYLLNEDKKYLGKVTGDVLQSIQDLSNDSGNLGNRDLLRATDGVVSKIRDILHGHWDEEDVRYLKKIQKVGVNLAKAAEEKEEDMSTLLSSCSAELEELLDDLGTPINTLGAESEPVDTEDEDFLGKELSA